ncbi:DHHC palmitoyltransferase-domain-containing protein [Gamsiella multidivaricata]|uniref:DHHC palmitoyltransferase-domain-containing protein n=1 Tax=Gamsiella multidivaricata TaxID=101098 RepID=UPI002220FA95|nr:DHHC palmitoyltransferase-domain-containing protein [Gamsiella multidivaricata]KAI7815779.1 DHHC palmitoyltransferase-domain-containing protein [Gamsiella multidivaricata]
MTITDQQGNLQQGHGTAAVAATTVYTTADTNRNRNRNGTSTTAVTNVTSTGGAVGTIIADAGTGSSAVALTVDGYRIHPSALATVAPSSAQNMTAVAAAQRAVALAAGDSTNATTNTTAQGSADDPSSTGCSSSLCFSVYNMFWNILQRLMPLGLAVVMGYIYYVYTFRVCIDYILHVQQRIIQAAVYLIVIDTLSAIFFISYIRCIFHGPGSPLKPPQRSPLAPIPPTTTLYQPQRTPKLLPVEGIRAVSGGHSTNSHPSDTTPLLQYTPATAGSPLSQYQATSQRISPPTTSIALSASEQKGGLSAGLMETFGGSINGNDTVRIEIEQCTGQTSLQRHVEQPIATLSIAKRDGRRRWCDICKIGKPDRCHHCSECDKCVLRMDHHCPWVGNCIGYNNHKFFYLFILYASVVSIWVVATMIPFLVTAIRRCEWSSPLNQSQQEEGQQTRCVFDRHWAFVTLVAFLLALLIVSFTGAHTVYILQNRTTIESLQDARSTFVRVQYAKPDPAHISPPGAGFVVVKLEPGEHLWDRGSRLENWKSIMGPSWWLWFLPYGNTPGDGVHDVYNDKVYRKLVSVALTQTAAQNRGIRGRVAALVPQQAVVGGIGSSQSTLILRSVDNQAADLRSSPRSEMERGQDQDASGYQERIESAVTTPLPTSHAWARPQQSEDSEVSVGSMGRSLLTPRPSSPQLGPVE